MANFVVELDWRVRFDIVLFFKSRHREYKSSLERWGNEDAFLLKVDDDLAVEFKLQFSEHILHNST